MDKKPTMAIQARGNEYLTDIAIKTYLTDLERLELHGKKGGAYWNFIVHELDTLGFDRDYLPTDHGTRYEIREN